MSDFLSTALGFPTAVYTVLLGGVLLYWLLVIAGLLDLDLHAPDGEVHLKIEFAKDIVKELDLDPGVDLGAHGPGVDLGDGAPELQPAVAPDGPSPGLGAQLLAGLGLHRVPLTVSASFVTFFGWVLSFLAGRAFPAPGPLLGTGIGFGALLLSLPAAGLIARPLSPLFRVHSARSRVAYLGQAVAVTTGRVDAGFGQAELTDEAHGMVVQIRCDHVNELKKGDPALLVHYDEAREAYVVEPLSTPRGQAIQARVAAARRARAR